MSNDCIRIPDWMLDADDPIAEQIVSAVIIADEVLSGNVENLEAARDAMVEVLTKPSVG